MKRCFRVLVLGFVILAVGSVSRSFAQDAEDLFDQGQYYKDEGREDSEVQEILQQIRNRAKAKIEKKERSKLKKVRISASIHGGYESNPLNSDSDTSTEEADSFVEERVGLNWVPMFTDMVGADVGYDFYNQNYSDQTQLDTMAHTLSSELKFLPFGDNTFSIQPGAEYEWVDYPNDDLSVYEAANPFIKFRYTPNEDWAYGLKMEYSDKVYDTRLARDNLGADIASLKREDERYTGEASLTRYWENHFLRLKGRFYHNDSNDAFQSFYDYNSYRGLLTLGGSYLDDKLDLSITPSYEMKDYDERVTGTETREDEIFQIKFDAKYQLAKNWSVDYGFSDRMSDSNASGGDYTNIINTLGVNMKF